MVPGEQNTALGTVFPRGMYFPLHPSYWQCTDKIYVWHNNIQAHGSLWFGVGFLSPNANATYIRAHYNDFLTLWYIWSRSHCNELLCFWSIGSKGSPKVGVRRDPKLLVNVHLKSIARRPAALNTLYYMKLHSITSNQTSSILLIKKTCCVYCQ